MKDLRKKERGDLIFKTINLKLLQIVDNCMAYNLKKFQIASLADPKCGRFLLKKNCADLCFFKRDRAFDQTLKIVNHCFFRDN